MKREDWTVGPSSVRSADKPGECSYCHVKVGGQHEADCVIRSRTVVVRLTFDLVVDEPESSDAGHITFRYGENACTNNLIYRLAELVKRTKKVGGCACVMPTSAEFVREATEDDEKGQRLFVKDLPG